MAIRTFNTDANQEEGLQYATDNYNSTLDQEGKPVAPLTTDQYLRRFLIRVLGDYYRQKRRKEILETKLTPTERDILRV